MIVATYVILGFAYGIPYFKFMDRQNQLNTYILSLQWWNIKFNWSESYGERKISLCVILPRFKKGIRYTEHYVIFDDSGISFRHLDMTN